MMRAIYVLSSFMLVVALGPRLVAEAAEPVSEPVLQKLREAVPKKATATPKKPRKILIFDGWAVFRHSSIPLANKAFELMGETTGAFSVEISDKLDVFNSERLRGFDAVLMNGTNFVKITEPSQRQALLEFVRGGKGFIGAHVGGVHLLDWPEGIQMVGALLESHPWTADGVWAIKIDEPKHPLNRCFQGQGFKVNDEIFQFLEPYSRENLRVLLSLDMTDEQTSKVPGIKRTDGDHAVAWVHRYGQGRVFYTALGHSEAIFTTPVFLRHYLDGIQYALGDLEADDSPSNSKVGKAHPAAQ